MTIDERKTKVLSLEDIECLAEAHGLNVTFRRGAGGKNVVLWFKGDQAESWALLMTSLTEVPVTVRGTRRVTGSGATDGTLHEAYAARLAEVNATRMKIGLEPVCN